MMLTCAGFPIGVKGESCSTGTLVGAYGVGTGMGTFAIVWTAFVDICNNVMIVELPALMAV